MVEHCVVPKCYKSIADAGEPTAKLIWSQIVLKYPNAKIVEEAPPDPIKSAKFTWHDKLLTKICENREHRKYVAFAVVTIDSDELFGQQVS